MYRTTCLIDGKVYIGKHKTSDLGDGYLGSGKLLTRAIRKHGIQNFIREVLHVFNSEAEMNLKEAELVTEEFCSREDTYNLCPGGKGGWGYVNQNGLNGGPDVQAYIKISGTKKQRFQEDPYRREQLLLSASMMRCAYDSKYPESWWKGKKHSDEARRKISKSSIGLRLGKKNGMSGSKWMTDGISSVVVTSDNIETFLQNGYTFGRKLRRTTWTGEASLLVRRQ